MQILNTLKLGLVVGHDRAAKSERVRGNHQVIAANGLAGAF